MSIRDWVFDLDNTLYPADSTLYDAIGDRMTAYVARVAGLDLVAGEKERERLFFTYGATVVGLLKEYKIDATHFLTEVHDVDLTVVPPDHDLNALIAALPGRKIVFTNGGADYAKRMMRQLALEKHFDIVVDLEANGLIPKPEPESYRRLCANVNIDPKRAVLIEDTLRNLEPAAAMGFETVLIGPVHPEPRPAYVHHCAHDLKDYLRAALGVDQPVPAA